MDADRLAAAIDRAEQDYRIAIWRVQRTEQEAVRLANEVKMQRRARDVAEANLDRLRAMVAAR